MGFKIVAVFVIIVLLAVGICFLFLKQQPAVQPSVKPTEALTITEKMVISSPAFENNRDIPAKYTCDGDNVNPPLEISDVPEETKSLLLIVDDPDAPMGTWIHWTVWNINPQTKAIEENSVPQGATEGMTDFGQPGYGGPCPPSGTHRYFFKLYALDTALQLDSSAKVNDLETAMEGHILAQAELIGLYR